MPKRQDTSSKAKGEPKTKKSKQSNATATNTKATQVTKAKGSKTNRATARAKPAKVAPAPARPTKAPVKKVTSPSKSSPKKKGELSDEAIDLFLELSDNVTSGGTVTASDLSQFTVADLKLVLLQNDRSTTGRKVELCHNVADCMTNGCPPRCPECGGGRLRVKVDGSFFCPGYMEDEDFQKCSFKCGKNEIFRIPWRNPPR